MKIREAKDFLVQQIVEQAQRENVPLSDLEKRMMYFSEGTDAVEDPASLNEAFEKQYDTTKYEKKISLLMRQAYTRIKKEEPERARRGNSALSTLSKGDHYILVLWGHPVGHSSVRFWPVYLSIGLPVAALLLFAYFFFPTPRTGVWRFSHFIPLVNPRVMQALFLSLVIVGVLFPRVITKATDWWFNFFDKVAGLDKKDHAEE